MRVTIWDKGIPEAEEVLDKIDSLAFGPTMVVVKSTLVKRFRGCSFPCLFMLTRDCFECI